MPTTTTTPRVSLIKYAWLSIVTSLVVIALKIGAYLASHSVGLLSDAAESLVNLAAAIVALAALSVAQSDADDGHHFGHTKAEYFSAALEGLLIFVAAGYIIYEAIKRLQHPEPLSNVGLGLLISILASLANGIVALVLLRAGKAHRSASLVADGKHLMADVWTSIGVTAGIGLVLLAKLAGMNCWWIDPIVAIIVGCNIIVTGFLLMKRSLSALLDASLDEEENDLLAQILRGYIQEGSVSIHGVRTRVAGRQRYAELHLLVPGAWSVQQAHDLSEDVEAAIHAQLADIDVMTHIEPIEDPRSFADRPDHEIHLFPDLSR
ncbi:MAG: cation diffusion facilitator family transporter [Propionibacteriaceae bacterium]